MSGLGWARSKVGCGCEGCAIASLIGGAGLAGCCRQWLGVGAGVPESGEGVGSAEEAVMERRGFVGTLRNPALLGRNYK